MIANIVTILYILTVSNESINNGTLQKGTAISRVDDDDGSQTYKYFNYLTSDSNDSIETTPFEKGKMYLITGKFTITQDSSINVRIISNTYLPLDKDNIPIMKPTIHLLGKTMDIAQLTEAGYTLQIQVKPYLSKEQFNPFLVNLTHPVNGRLKNALTMAKKNSTVHITGLFFLVDKQIYCEILEFQFVASKPESENTTISVPWKSKADSTAASSSKAKSAIDRRIELVRQSAETKIPPTSPSAVPNQIHKKQNIPVTKMSESSLSQNQTIEIYDSSQEINYNEETNNDDKIKEIDSDDETVDENNGEDPPADISNDERKSKKKRKYNDDPPTNILNDKRRSKRKHK